jgi:methoxymalonate biosynthesis acyl carrier protein
MSEEKIDMEKREIVRKFIARYVGGKEFDDSVNIFETGLVNSLFVMQLVMFVENEFGVSIQNEDLALENFKDVNSIVALIESK